MKVPCKLPKIQNQRKKPQRNKSVIRTVYTDSRETLVLHDFFKDPR